MIECYTMISDAKVMRQLRIDEYGCMDRMIDSFLL